MAQSYFPPSASAPTISSTPIENSPASSTSTLHEGLEKAAARGEDMQGLYVEQRDRLTNALDSTVDILDSLRKFNKESWVVRYPTLKPSASSTSERRLLNRRSLSFADDPNTETEVVVAPITPTSAKHASMKRSLTLATIDDAQEVADANEPAEPTEGRLIPDELSVLRLDLKFGSHGSSVVAGGLVSQLEKASIANLLDDRISSSISHMEKLRIRIQDTSSKVLVTGDLNAGKSTFVNALLGREVMPVDQQPCTTMFCEVHDSIENDGVEEVHVVTDSATYNREDEATFTRVALADLESVVTESDANHICKIYVKDARHPHQSLVANGVVDISLIDAPGLNRDSLQTTAVFARQEEIDVVVFVVSAENHFTLSAKEFLWQASNEKAYLFIVVNRFDQIRDKARCKRLVMEQIKQLSPRTWEEAEELVHFVDSSSALARALNSQTATSAGVESFDKMESSLRSFVLLKRAKSKLTPATTYLTHVLVDVDFLVSANTIVAEAELEAARAELARARPVFDKLKKGKNHLEESLDGVEDAISTEAGDKANALILLALERVAKGEAGVTKDQLLACGYSSTANTPLPQLPEYPGLLRIWEYARQVREALLASLDLSVKLAEDEARVLTSKGVDRVFELADRHLPEGMSRGRKVFMPEAMFLPKTGKRRSVAAVGTHGLGIGLAQRLDLLEVSFHDVFDIHHHISSLTGGKEDKLEDDDSSTTLGLMSLGLGAITMVGGKTVGVRGVIEGIARLSDIFGNPSTRKWVAPILGVVTVGLGAYLILELPSTIPKQVGRSIRRKLILQEDPLYSGAVSALVTGTTRPQTFVEENSARIGKEARKVMRLAGWEVREKYRTATEESGKEVKEAEDKEANCVEALKTFANIQNRAGEVQESLRLNVL